MNTYIITIKGHEKSEQSSHECELSCEAYGIEAERFDAITPEDRPIELLEAMGIGTDGFYNEWTNPEPAAGCFLSHYRLWQKCVEMGLPIIILEHDARVVSEPPSISSIFVSEPFLINLGKPSYGACKKMTDGLGPLRSKHCLPGTHGYMLNPLAAERLIEGARIHGASNPDVYLRLDRFSFLYEFYPWPVEARDTFTTIQNEKGCIAKHAYQENRGGFEVIPLAANPKSRGRLTLQEITDNDPRPSDKGTDHTYLETYEEWFSKLSAPKLLEIGVKDGDSLRMWRKYFGEEAYIAGIDINQVPGKHADQLYLGASNSMAIAGALRDAGVMFDLIIDDGDHSIASQLSTYYNLKPFLAPGGRYVIEDIQNVWRDGATMQMLGFQLIDLREKKNRSDDVLAWCMR